MTTTTSTPNLSPSNEKTSTPNLSPTHQKTFTPQKTFTKKLSHKKNDNNFPKEKDNLISKNISKDNSKDDGKDYKEQLYEDMYKDVNQEPPKRVTLLDKKAKDQKYCNNVLEAAEEATIALQPMTRERVESGVRMPLPVTVAFQDRDIDVGRTTPWILHLCSQMSPLELEHVWEECQDTLSYGEILSINLLKKAINGDEKAERLFWDIQMKMLPKKNIQNQLNIAVNKPDKIVTTLLDDIAGRLAAENENDPHP